MFTATETLYSTTTGAAATWSTWGARVDPLVLHTGVSTTWSLNAFKGALGERVLNATVTAGLFDRGAPSWAALTPHRVGPTGLDAVFIKVTGDGVPNGVMVADAKFGGARQGFTRTGLQMSARWVRPRLVETGRDYARAANAMGRGGVRVGDVAGGGALTVPMPRGGQVTVRVTNDGVVASQPVDARVLRQQLRRTAAALGDAARQGRYEPRILKLDVHKNEYVIAMQRLDRTTGTAVGRAHVIRGPWGRLGSGTRRLLRECVRDSLAEHASSDADIDKLCRAACRDPSFLRRLRLSPRNAWTVGMDRRMASTAAGAAAVAMLVEVGAGLLHGQIRWSRVAKTAVLGGASAAASYWVTSQVQLRLASASAARALVHALPLRSVSGSAVAGYAGLAAGAGVGVATALGAYALGLVDARQARVMGAASAAGAVAAAAVPAGAFAAAGAFGTAGTGAAIGGLSGAAFNSAALAWVGGAAGGGAALGSAILTGGAAVALVAASAAVHAAAKKLDAIERERLVEGRLELVQRHLAA